MEVVATEDGATYCSLWMAAGDEVATAGELLAT